jgi:hypothetical protein
MAIFHQYLTNTKKILSITKSREEKRFSASKEGKGKKRVNTPPCNVPANTFSHILALYKSYTGD